MFARDGTRCQSSPRQMRLWFLLLGGLAVVAVVAASAPAGNGQRVALRPGVAIGEVRLGMTLREVRAVLGTRARVVHRALRDRDGGRYTEYRWGAEPSWTVGLYKGFFDRAAKVVLVGTTSRVSAPAGVGTGASYRLLQRALGARCYVPPLPRKRREYFPGYPLQMECFAGSGVRRTRFGLVNRCAVPTDRYIVCPPAQRRYFAYEVTIYDARSRRLRRWEERTPWVRVR